MMVKVSIIILSYNTKELTTRCIDSIIKQHRKQLESGEFEILVVDNASTDGSMEAVRNFQLKLIRNKENYGFAKGNNIGATHARGTYVFFLNSDTEVLDEGIARMVGYLDKQRNIGILGAKLQNGDGTAQPSTGTFYTLLPTILMLFGGERFGLLRQSPTEIVNVDWVSGAAMMVRKDVFSRLGGFDEKFFMYVEDMELCFRAKKMGFATYFYPNISIRHQALGSSNRPFAIIHIYKGLLYFYKKHSNFVQYTIIKLLLIVKACIAITVGTLTENTYLTSTYRKALSLSL